jgi:Tol biopolymer transport system component
MTADRGFERQLPDALADLAMSSYPAYVDDVLAITSRTRRRPAWQFPSRWLPFEPPEPGSIGLPWKQLRLAAVIVAVLLLIAALIVAYVGSHRLPDPYGLAANGKVAYSADHAAWVLDENGTTRLLMDGPGDEVGLTYSLDGTRIAFIRLLDGKEYLWAADADGTDQVQLVAEPVDPGLHIIWSADSRRVVVNTSVGGVDSVLIVEADGSGSRLLKLPFPAQYPAWRPPDGRELVVRGEVNGLAQLFVVAADGSSIREIGPRAKGLFLDGSPDGRSWDHQGPAWSPDGSRLGYNSIDAVDNADGVRFQVHIIEPDGSDTLLAGPNLNVMESWPAWSPDGHLIAFERWRWNGLSWLAILPADGSRPGLDVELKTSFQPAMGWTVTWSPDGKRILAFWDRTRGAVSIDVATGEFERVDLPLTDSPSWQRR